MYSENHRIQFSTPDCEKHSSNGNTIFAEDEFPAFESLKTSVFYPKGAMLFTEGQSPKGIYLIRKGRFKLSACSVDGRIIIFDVIKAGEILGISSTVSNSPHIATAEAIEDCQISFVPKKDFLDYLENNPQIALTVLKQLSRDYRTACHHICSLGLSASAADKLATLLIGWCKARGDERQPPYRLDMLYTHEEIAQMIGTSRETVTRILRSFSDRELIVRKGSELVIPSLRSLEATIGTRQNLKG